MVPYIDSTIEFVHRSTSDPNQTDAVLKAAVGLLGDLGDSFKARMYPVFTQPFVTELINIAVSNEDSKEVALWAQRIINTIRSRAPL